MALWSDWNPWRELDTLRREVDRVFEGFRPGWNRVRSAFLPGRSSRGYPLLNVYEDSETMWVEALAPGLDPDSLDVSVKGDTLRIAGEKAPLEGVKPEQYHRNERATGRFARTLQLDTEIAQDQVEAAYENGILTVTLPKSEEARPKKIAVDVK